MKLKWISVVPVCFSSLLLAGCVNTVDGRQRAGVPFQQDRAEGRYQRPLSQVWGVAQDVLKHHGTVTSVDTARQSLQGKVQDRDVWISVGAVDPTVTQVIVQARTKGGLADFQMAAYLDKEIAVRLASGGIGPSGSAKP